ncbi:GspE/PulE family protein [bacterium]
MNNPTTKTQRIAQDRALLEALVRRKLLEPAKAKSILNKLKQEKDNPHLEDILIEKNLVNENDLLETLVTMWNIPSVSLHDHIVDAEVLNLIPADMAQKYTIFPLFKIHQELFLAMADPKDVQTIDKVSQLTKLIIKPALSSRRAIRSAIKTYYRVNKEKAKVTHKSHKEDIEDILEIIESEEQSIVEETPLHQLQKMTEEAPVVKMTSMILNQAVIEGASDIHISPEENQLRVRIRVDGLLRDSFNLPKHLQHAIISRIKVLSHLDIAEQRVPQDGQLGLRLKDGRAVAIRVSTLPVNHGEDLVLRILDKDASLLQLENLGCEQNTLERMNLLLSNAYGIILVTGPTGSGKTTTLYACLNKLCTGKKNIITLEDPIEYNLASIRQSQVNYKSGMTFAKGLRSILRHDPDIIMVGEIRDSETANIAIQAAMTGHLVLSTLHTNTAAGSISRLLEMGIESFLLSSALLGVQAQRLVRRICPKCKESYEQDITPFERLFKEIDIKMPESLSLFRGKGCDECRNTGYSGRISLMEVLPVNEPIKRLVAQSEHVSVIQKAAVEQGMHSLLYDGWLKVKKGITTIEEIMRVINFS